METVWRLARGEFEGNEIRRYMFTEALVFWGTIFAAWLSYPAEHHYSIMTHTFSFLGSFEKQHNPDWWWVFSMALSFWGVATIPVVFYIYRRFEPISVWGARAGAFLLLVACVNMVMVATFPDGHGKAIGDWEYGFIHARVAGLVFLGYGFGIILHGLLLLKDWLTGRTLGELDDAAYRRLVWPYLVWCSIVGTAVYHLVKWESVYPQWKAAAAAEGRDIGSPWSAAMNTIYSFPLWENTVIYAIFLFLIWFTLALPPETPGDWQNVGA